MGVKVILLINISFLISCSIKNLKIEKKMEVYKQVALCSCISNNYTQIDPKSKILNDVSKSVLFLESDGYNFNSLLMLDSFVNLKTVNYYKMKNSHTTSSDSNSNEVIKLCLDFLNSKELTKYLISLK